MSVFEGDWLYEGFVRKAREGDVSCSRRALIRFSEYVLERKEDPPAFLTRYVAECINKALKEEEPSRGTGVARALGLVGEPGKSPAQEVKQMLVRRQHFEKFCELLDNADLSASGAEIVNAILAETGDYEKFKVGAKTIQRSIDTRMGADWLHGLKRWLDDPSVESE